MEELHQYYKDKYERAEEPGGMYDCLFWFVVVVGAACLIALAINAILLKGGV